VTSVPSRLWYAYIGVRGSTARFSKQPTQYSVLRDDTVHLI